MAVGILVQEFVREQVVCQGTFFSRLFYMYYFMVFRADCKADPILTPQTGKELSAKSMRIAPKLSDFLPLQLDNTTDGQPLT